MLPSSQKLSPVVFRNQIARIAFLIFIFTLLGGQKRERANGGDVQLRRRNGRWLDILQWRHDTLGNKRRGVFRIVQPADYDQRKRCGRAIDFAEWRAAGGSNLHDHRICDAHERRSGDKCELHDKAQRSGLLRRDLLRHHWNLPSAGVGFRMGANWGELYGQYHGNGTRALRATGGSDDGAMVLFGRGGDYGDRAAAGRNAGSHVHFLGWRRGWLDAVWFGIACQQRSANHRPEWRRAQSSGFEPHRRLHGAEPKPAEHKQRGSRRDVPDYGLRVAGSAGQQQSNGDAFDQDNELREHLGFLQQSGDVRTALEHRVDQGRGNAQLQQFAWSPVKSGPIYTVEQRDGFFLY